MRCVIVGDLHLAATPPGRRAEGYLGELWAMLREIGQIASDGACDAVIFVGDIFHHKAPNRTPYGLVKTLCQILDDYPPVYIVPGNHDLANGTLESLSRQPLSVLAHQPNVAIVTGDAVIEVAGVRFGFVPGTGPVCDAEESEHWRYAQDCDVLVAHAPVDFTSRPWKTIHPDELSLLCSVLVYGHQHDQARVCKQSTETLKVVATGALARGSITEADRLPCVLVMDDSEGPGNFHVDIVKLESALPSEALYRWTELAVEKAGDASIQLFLGALSEASLAGFSSEGLVAHLRARSDVPSSVVRAAERILQSL